ncbi:MAG: peptide chain release factor 1 [Firmicutes bacterium]|nr:peptide chain release factor 1 [Bacillota bacterium]
MLKRLDDLEKTYMELEKKISLPEIMAQMELWQKYLKEHSALMETVNTYREFKKTRGDLRQAEEMLGEEPDREMVEYLKEEISELSARKKELEERLKTLLIPRDPGDEKNVIIEIRAGTGGEEAALFSADLMRMYTRYAERNNWKIELLDMNSTDIGGIKEVVFAIEGKNVYSRLKFESGVHRVQRVPVTESGGRIHTSAATVAVLPEMEEIELEIKPQDLRVDIFCSTGPGGQSVNTTQSAVRITHMPSGVVATCQDEKSQLKNKEKAMRVLRSRLHEKMQQEQEAELAMERRNQVGSGDRSERIRTYNFPQNRVTDHRIKLTLHKLDIILDGTLDEIIDPLIRNNQARLLSMVGE